MKELRQILDGDLPVEGEQEQEKFRASWLVELLDAAQKDLEGFELSPKEVEKLLDRAFWVNGNGLVN